jgi:release factor glutamine methyltransferase
VTIHELVHVARDRFISAGINANVAGLDAEVLAREVLGWDRARLLTERHEAASSAFLLNYEHYVARRVRREPISYILGTREFWSLDFEVTPDVLIPRHETELIIEEALKRVREPFSKNTGEKGSRTLFMDVGTGSGVLAIVLAREFPEARVIATDISAGALSVARRNAARHGTSDRIRFVETSFLDGLDEFDGQADLIVSNPPYVPSVSGPGLSPEVRDYEPGVAVFGGADGLEGLRRVLADSIPRLAPEGWLIVEFGCGQDDAVTSLVQAQPALSLVALRSDLQEIPRTAVLRKRA